jgi:flagellar biosynthesis protein FlhB
MSDEGGEKKFELSEKRRNKLRQEGMVPKSHDVSTAAILAVGLSLLVLGGQAAIGYLREIMRRSFLEVGASNLSLKPETIGSLFTSDLWLYLGIFVGAIAIAVFVTQVAQVGLSFGDEVLDLKLERLNPVSNLQNLFSLNKLTQSGQNLAKLAIIAAFAWMALRQIQDSPVFTRPVNLRELGEAYASVAWGLGWHIVMVLGALAGADLIWQRWKFNRDHRMTFEEVKEERRQQEMSPEVMKKRRLMGRKYSMRKQLENMKDATVVVVNPTHYAVALKYKKGVTEAPIVVAKGIRGNALRIKERAYELRLLVKRDVPLAQGLYKYGRIDQPIPPIFYQAVAAILALLYKQGFRATAADGFETRPATPLGSYDDPEIWNTEND